jgi:hypothetical protein
VKLTAFTVSSAMRAKLPSDCADLEKEYTDAASRILEVSGECKGVIGPRCGVGGKED